mmetsp:Transcript_41849/g.112095  ORF Transcript_41849/g.112095 Transcript_41849/m.112095 type:complete len:93 (+) Transcript_41849:236-514(+)
MPLGCFPCRWEAERLVCGIALGGSGLAAHGGGFEGLWEVDVWRWMFGGGALTARPRACVCGQRVSGVGGGEAGFVGGVIADWSPCRPRVKKK